MEILRSEGASAASLQAGEAYESNGSEVGKLVNPQQIRLRPRQDETLP